MSNETNKPHHPNEIALATGFKNPWPFPTTYDSNTQGTLSTVVPVSEKLKIQSICPIKGVFQIVLNKLWQQLTIDLAKHNIKTIDDNERFKQYIANIRVSSAAFGVDSGSPANGTMSQTNPSNDSGRTSPTTGENAERPDELRQLSGETSIGSKPSPSGGRGGRGRTVKGQAGKKTD